MNKCHTPIVWHNDTTPAINETNLNYEDGCIDTIDDRVVAMDTAKANQSDLLKAFKDVSLNTTTGVITFTLFDNTTKTIDTLLEKVAINFDYDDNPASAHYQNLIIELEDGTYKYIDMSALITEYEFATTDTIAFTVGLDGSVSADVRDGSITGTKLQPNYLADVTAQATVASDAATASNANQLLSEGYANGTQGGVPVSSSSPYYHNNAKYWKEQAAAIAQQSLGGLSDVTITSAQDGQVLAFDNNSGEWINKTLSLNSRTRKNITNNLTNLSVAVSEQNLEKYGYAIGDYFERTDGARTYTYLLADLNHLKGTDTPYCISTNHIAIVVDTDEKIIWGSSLSGGYVGSNLHSYLSGTVLTNIKSDMIALFGGTTGLEHLLPNDKLFTTSSGASWGWSTNQYITALTESNVVGHMEFSRMDGFQEGEEPRFLEVFSKWKWTEIYSKDFWLRNISSNSGCACLAGFAGLMGIKSPTATDTYAVGLISFY